MENAEARERLARLLKHMYRQKDRQVLLDALEHILPDLKPDTEQARARLSELVDAVIANAADEERERVKNIRERANADAARAKQALACAYEEGTAKARGMSETILRNAKADAARIRKEAEEVLAEARRRLDADKALLLLDEYLERAGYGRRMQDAFGHTRHAEVPSPVLCHASIFVASICGTNPVNVVFGGRKDAAPGGE